jgi:hypothetical protein
VTTNKERKRAKEIFEKLDAEDISSTGEVSVLKNPASRQQMGTAGQHNEAAKNHHVAAIIMKLAIMARRNNMS